MIMKEVWFYQHTNNKVPVVEWLKSLDKLFRIRLQDRLTRIEQDDKVFDNEESIKEYLSDAFEQYIEDGNFNVF